jgi:hypothetical protein
MAGIGDYILARQDRADRIYNAGKAAEFYVKSNPEVLGQLGMQEDEWANMGAQDKAGLVQGVVEANTQKQLAARMEDYAAQARLRDQQAQDDQSIGSFLKSYADAPPVSTPAQEIDYGGEEPATTRDRTPAERFHYALSESPVTGRAVPRLIDALAKYGHMEDDQPVVVKDNPYPGMAMVTSRSGRGGVHVVTDPKVGKNSETLAPTYTEDPVTGARALLYGKSAQSTGFNPAKAAPQLVPQHDDDGNLVGWSQLDARGHATFLPNRGGAKLKQAADQDGNPIDGYYVDQAGKLHDVRSAMQKALGTEGTTPAKSAAPPVYKAPTDVVAAFKAGKLSRADAAKILTQQFGVPLK